DVEPARPGIADDEVVAVAGGSRRGSRRPAEARDLHGAVGSDAGSDAERGAAFGVAAVGDGECAGADSSHLEVGLGSGLLQARTERVDVDGPLRGAVDAD